METSTNKSSNPMLWIAGIAITLFCAAGVGAIMGWIPTSFGSSASSTALETPKARDANVAAVKPHAAAEPKAPVHVANAAPAKKICAECGVIESTHEIDTKGEGSG